MAEYRVVKDGVEIKIMKSLSAAKKAADSKGAEVFLGDKRIYTAQVKESEEKAQAAEPAEKAPAIKKYRLKALMNVREKPNMSGRILSTMKTGTVVTVRGISFESVIFLYSCVIRGGWMVIHQLSPIK